MADVDLLASARLLAATQAIIFNWFRLFRLPLFVDQLF